MVHDRAGLLRLTAEIRSHLAELDAVLSELASYSVQADDKERLILRAYGSLLHDFYTGVEAVFQIVADEIDGSRPTASDWHRRLVVGMAAELPGIRPPVISSELRETLDPYRGFRHIFRNVYGRRLDWDRMRPLIEALPDVSARFSQEINQFLKTMATLCESDRA